MIARFWFEFVPNNFSGCLKEAERHESTESSLQFKCDVA